MATHRDTLLSLLHSRQVQTNEVNRCVRRGGSAAPLGTREDRPVHLVEIGSSAGLNLLFDRYACTLEPDAGPPGRFRPLGLGPHDSPVQPRDLGPRRLAN